MKVLQVSKFFPFWGGIEAVTKELADGMSRAGVDNAVLCCSRDARTRSEIAPAGYEVVRAASIGRALSTSLSPALVHHLRRMAQRADVLHVHMPDPMAAMALWLVRPRAPIVLHWHSDVIRQQLALRLYAPLQRWLLDRAAAVIATSQPYADASTALARCRGKVDVVPIGISDNLGDARDGTVAAIRGRYGDRSIVFALGRMTYYKGFDVLIEAAAALPDDCVVLIGGQGELLAQHRQDVARRGLVDKVHFLGQVADEDLSSYFAACDVFCMPSVARAEAYGVAMLEAMVMGKPIVATEIAGSGVPWVNAHGQSGFNAPAGRAGPLAQALERLLSDAPLRAELGGLGRRRYVANFTAQDMIRHILAIHDRVVAAH